MTLLQNQFNQFVCDNKTVYTSFDGDLMIYIDMMREHAIRMNCISLNPEHVLGYHLSTTSQGNSKKRVMKDCVSIANFCDDFWVYTDDPGMKLASLPEGVIVEILHWTEAKGRTELRFFCIEDVVKDLRDNRINEGQKITVNKELAKQELGETTLFESFDYLSRIKDELHPIAFIDIPNQDFKYVDWVRAKCYESARVPVVPQLVIAPHVYMKYSTMKQYDKDCKRLIEDCSEVWGIYYSEESKQALIDRYTDVKDKLILKSMKEIGVPKYTNPLAWSITTKEQREVLRL